VTLNYDPNENLPQVSRKLTAMRNHEQITVYMATGVAPVSGPVTCTSGAGRIEPAGPPVKVLVGTDGTEVIGPGQSAGNTGEGTFHLDHCVVTGDTGPGDTGNAGNTGAG